jgi:hypothetical protein
MTSRTKAADAAALRAAGIPLKAFTPAQFRARNGGLSEGFYRKMRKKKLGPRETKILGLTLITEEAETEWRRKREAETNGDDIAGETTAA